MEWGILLLWRENNKLLYLGVLLQDHANKRGSYWSPPLAKVTCSSRGSRLQKTPLDVWSCIRGGSLLLQHPQKWVNKYSWEDWKCRVHGLCISVPPPRNAARHSSWLFLPGMCCYSDKRETRVMFLLPQKSGFALCWIAWRQTHSEFGKQIS